MQDPSGVHRDTVGPHRDAGAYIIALAVACVVGWPSLFFPPGSDQATFQYVGERWLAGSLPYVGALDTKPPAIYLYYALFELLPQSLGSLRWHSFHLGELLLFPLLLLMVRDLGFGRRVAVGVVCGCTLFYYLAVDFWSQAQAEFPAMILACLALVLLRRGLLERGWLRIAVAGALVALIVLFKQPFAILVALLPLLLWGRLRADELDRSTAWRALGAYALGGALPALALIGVYAAAGSMEELWFGMVRLPLLYAKHARLPATPPGVIAHFVAYNLPVFAFAGYGIVVLTRRLRESALREFAIWSALLLAAVLLQRKLWFYHWIVLVPAFGVLVTLSLVDLYPRLRRRLPRAATLACLALPLALNLVLLASTSMDVRPGKSNNYVRSLHMTIAYVSGNMTTAEYYATFHGPFHDMDADWKLGRFVAERTPPGSTLHILEFRPAIYVFARRHCSTKFFFASILGFVGSRGGKAFTAEYLELTYGRQPPDYILFGVDGPWNSEAARPFQPARYGYRLVATHPDPVAGRMGLFARPEQIRRTVAP